MTELFSRLTLSKDIESEKPDNIEIIRLVSSYWKDARGIIHYERRIIPLRRKSKGYQLLQEDCYNIGVKEAILSISNLDECDDGIYQIIIGAAVKDWETGYIDDYDLKLVKHDE